MEKCQKKEKAKEKKNKAKEDKLGLIKKTIRSHLDAPLKSKTGPEEKKSQFLPVQTSSIGDSPMKQEFKSETKLDQLLEDVKSEGSDKQKSQSASMSPSPLNRAMTTPSPTMMFDAKRDS